MSGIIQTYGLFWRADAVHWGKGSQPGRLLGVPVRARSAAPSDFRLQSGIYVLYVGHDVGPKDLQPSKDETGLGVGSREDRVGGITITALEISRPKYPSDFSCLATGLVTAFQRSGSDTKE